MVLKTRPVILVDRYSRKRKCPDFFNNLDPKLDRNLRLALELSMKDAGLGAGLGDLPVKDSGLSRLAPPVKSAPEKVHVKIVRHSATKRRQNSVNISASLAPKETEVRQPQEPCLKSRESKEMRAKDRRHGSLPRGFSEHELYRGVLRANGRFLALITHRGAPRVLGSFDTSVEAAAAHDEMAARLAEGTGGGTALTNLQVFDGPVPRFGYGLVQEQAFRVHGGFEPPKPTSNPHWLDLLLKGR